MDYLTWIRYFISHMIHGHSLPPLLTGTSIKFYGNLVGGSSLYLEPDGNSTNVLANGSSITDKPSVLLSVDNLQDGDHQLLGEVTAIQANGIVMLYYFESVLLLVFPYSTLSQNSVLTSLSCPGLKILLERALTSSTLERMRRMSPHRQPLWTTLARILYSTNPPTGRISRLFWAMMELNRQHRTLVIR